MSRHSNRKVGPIRTDVKEILINSNNEMIHLNQYRVNIWSRLKIRMQSQKILKELQRQDDELNEYKLKNQDLSPNTTKNECQNYIGRYSLKPSKSWFRMQFGSQRPSVEKNKNSLIGQEMQILSSPLNREVKITCLPEGNSKEFFDHDDSETRETFQENQNIDSDIRKDDKQMIARKTIKMHDTNHSFCAFTTCFFPWPSIVTNFDEEVSFISFDSTAGYSSRYYEEDNTASDYDDSSFAHITEGNCAPLDICYRS